MIDHTRHSGIFDVSNQSATLIGAGGIGAITAITLGKMGLGDMCVLDDDDVSDVNVATQFYASSDIGSQKVQALEARMAELAEDTIFNCLGARVRPETDWGLIANPIIISAVDSITARKGIWHAIMDKPWLWYLDARMSAEVFQLYVVKGKEMGSRIWYDEHLAGIDEASIPDEPCTSKATIYTGMIAAGHIAKTIRMIATGMEPRRLIVHDIVNDYITRIG